MANYYKESVERITEQMIEQEVLEEMEEIRLDAIKNIGVIERDTLDYIGKVEWEALDYIEEVKVYTIGEDGDAGEVGKIKSEALEYIEENKVKLASFGNSAIESATQTYEDIIKIKEDTDAIDESTVAEIEHNIRQMIVDKGYVMKIECDEYGNADIVLVKEVTE